MSSAWSPTVRSATVEFLGDAGQDTRGGILWWDSRSRFEGGRVARSIGVKSSGIASLSQGDY
jgi:hypothetical protein